MVTFCPGGSRLAVLRGGRADEGCLTRGGERHGFPLGLPLLALRKYNGACHGRSSCDSHERQGPFHVILLEGDRDSFRELNGQHRMKLKVVGRRTNLSVGSIEEADAGDAYQNRSTHRIGALELILEYLARPHKLLSEARATGAGARGVGDLGNETYTLVPRVVQHQVPVPVVLRERTAEVGFHAIYCELCRRVASPPGSDALRRETCEKLYGGIDRLKPHEFAIRVAERLHVPPFGATLTAANACFTSRRGRQCIARGRRTKDQTAFISPSQQANLTRENM